MESTQHHSAHQSISLLLFIMLFCTGCDGNSQIQNSGYQVFLAPHVTGFDQPVDIQHAGDERLFIVEKPGRIKIIDHDGISLTKPYLDISGRIESSGNEQGLLGLAFHPDYSANGYFFVNYTKKGDSTVISRFKVSSDPNIADGDSEFILMTIAQPYTNHNAGQLAFGPDKYLYIGTGDGGSAGDPGNRSQDKGELLGKMLRIDVNPEESKPYGIPASNPFINDPAARPEIWSLGLRNPWRYSFDPETGDLWIGDVGQNAWEEINVEPSQSEGGINYGWRCYEGSHAFNTNGCSSDQSDYAFPVHEYSHADPTFPCSVTGGYVYHGGHPEIHGRYFYADYCNGRVYTLEKNDEGAYDNQLVYTKEKENFSTFGVDIKQELYVAGLMSGVIYKVDVILDIDEQDEVSALQIFPVPAKEIVSIITDPALVLSGLEFYTDAGERVYQHTGVFTSRTDINTSGFARGLYIVRIITESGQMYRKKIILR